MGLRPLRRDAAAVNTPKRMTLTPFSEGCNAASSNERTFVLAEAVSVSGTLIGFREAPPLPYGGHIASSTPLCGKALITKLAAEAAHARLRH